MTKSVNVTKIVSMKPISVRDYRKKVVTEKAFLAQIMELAGDLGWKTYHTWSSIHSAAGFPDLVLVRERLIMAEVKTDKGKLSEFQLEWICSTRRAGVETYIWRPVNWDSIVQVLTRRIEKT